MVASAVLLNGSTYVKMVSFCNCIGQRDLWLCGDGHCDSPGDCANYGTHNMLDHATDNIFAIHTVQMSEVQTAMQWRSKASSDAWKVAAKEGVAKFVATDRHISIAADMKRDHLEEEHYFDVWHLAKGVAKKVTEKGKKKGSSDALPWIKSISSRLWFCGQGCGSKKQLLKGMCLCVVHHIADIHSWNSADVYHECCRPPIPPVVGQIKRCLFLVAKLTVQSNKSSLTRDFSKTSRNPTCPATLEVFRCTSVLTKCATKH